MIGLARDLVTYALGILAGWWLAGRWGAGVAALIFCAARGFVAMVRMGAPERG